MALVNDDTSELTSEVARGIRIFRFMERMHLTYEQALSTPNEVMERAFLIWKLDAIRDTLNSKEQPN